MNVPFGQVPVIEDGGVKVAQSSAILRYLAKKADLFKNRILNEFSREGSVKIVVATEAFGLGEGSEEDFRRTAKVKVKCMETLMLNWGSDYILHTISYADYNLFDMLDILSIMSPGFLDEFPTLLAYHDRMASRPALKAYRATDAFTLLSQNG